MVGRFFKTHNQKRRGLTLTELAVVLAGAVMVSGTIWMVVGTVWNSYHYYKMKEEVVTLVDNVRDYYGPIGGLYSNAAAKTPLASNGIDITNILNDDDRRLIPIEMRVNRASDTSPIQHSLATAATGTVHAVILNSGRTLRLQLQKISRPNCIKFLMEFPFLLPEMGVLRIAANTHNTTVDLTNISSPGGSVTLPMPLPTAETWCDVVTTAGNEVDIDFKIRN